VLDISILQQMAQKPETPPMLLERRTGRTESEFEAEDLTFEEALERFLSAQEHVRQIGVYRRMNGSAPQGIGKDNEIKLAGTVMGHSAEHYASLLNGPELESAIERGDVSRDVSDLIKTLSQPSRPQIAPDRDGRKRD